MMLDVEDSIFVLHSLLSSLRRDPRFFHLFDMPEEDLVTFKLGFSSGWMMGNYTITVKILSHRLLRDLRSAVVADLWSEPSHHHESPLCIFQATLFVRGDPRDAFLAEDAGPVRQYLD